MEQIPYIRRAKRGEAIELAIPVCCREGHKDCPHVAKPQKKTKRNIGL